MDLKALQHEAHAIAREKGWWDEPRTFGDLIALVYSELSEALEAYRLNPNSVGPSVGPIYWHNVGTKRPPYGVAIELADVVIRVADMAEFYECPLESIEVTGVPPELPMDRPVQSFGDWIAALHFEVSTLAETWWASGGDIWAWRPYAELVVEVVNNMAAHYGIDLDAAIELKMAYNRTRPYRHGGKAL